MPILGCLMYRKPQEYALCAAGFFAIVPSVTAYGSKRKHIPLASCCHMCYI